MPGARAILWHRETGPVEVVRPVGVSECYFYDVNDHGVVVGGYVPASGGPQKPFRWTADAEPDKRFVEIATPAGMEDFVLAFRINERSEMLLQASANGPIVSAVISSSGDVITSLESDLDNPRFLSLNDYGEILGVSLSPADGDPKAFLRLPGMSDFSTSLAASYPDFSNQNYQADVMSAKMNNFGEFGCDFYQGATSDFYFFDGDFQSFRETDDRYLFLLGLNDHPQILFNARDRFYQSEVRLASGGQVVPVSSFHPEIAGYSTSHVRLNEKGQILGFHRTSTSSPGKRLFILHLDQDADHDGIADDWESYYGLSANYPADAHFDSDGDGYSNLAEFRLRRDPGVVEIASAETGATPDLRPGIDTDGDGMPNQWEIEHGLNWEDSSDAGHDPDRDGFVSLEEFHLKTNPVGKPSYQIVDLPGELLSEDGRLEISYQRESGYSGNLASPTGDHFCFHWQPGSESSGGEFLKISHGSQLRSVNVRDGASGVIVGQGVPLNGSSNSRPAWFDSSGGQTLTASGQSYGYFTSVSSNGRFLLGVRRINGVSQYFVHDRQVQTTVSLPLNGRTATAWGKMIVHSEGYVMAPVRESSGRSGISVWKRTSGIQWDHQVYIADAQANHTFMNRTGSPIVAGTLLRSGKRSVFSWEPDWGFSGVGHAGGGTQSYVTAMSEGGTFGGYSSIADRETGELRDCGFVSSQSNPGGYIGLRLLEKSDDGESRVVSLNDHGEVIGTARDAGSKEWVPHFWRGTKKSFPLSEIVHHPGKSAQFTQVKSLNNRGEILVYGSINFGVWRNHILQIDGDTDDDGLPDRYENARGMNPFDDADGLSDPDEDGLLTRDEFRHQTDPLLTDTDRDGMPDGWEVEWGLDALNPANARQDPDQDRVSNLREYEIRTVPTGLYDLSIVEVPAKLHQSAAFVTYRPETDQYLINRRYSGQADQPVILISGTSEASPSSQVSLLPLVPGKSATASKWRADGVILGTASDQANRRKLVRWNFNDPTEPPVPLTGVVSGWESLIATSADGNWLLARWPRSNGSRTLGAINLKDPNNPRMYPDLDLVQGELPPGQSVRWTHIGNDGRIRGIQQDYRSSPTHSSVTICSASVTSTGSYRFRIRLSDPFELPRNHYPSLRIIREIEGHGTLFSIATWPSYYGLGKDQVSHYLLPPHSGTPRRLKLPEYASYQVIDANTRGEFIAKDSRFSFLNRGQGSLRLDALRISPPEVVGNSPGNQLPTLAGLLQDSNCRPAQIESRSTVSGILMKSDRSYQLWTLKESQDQDQNGLKDDWELAFRDWAARQGVPVPRVVTSTTKINGSVYSLEELADLGHFAGGDLEVDEEGDKAESLIDEEIFEGIYFQSVEVGTDGNDPFYHIRKGKLPGENEEVIKFPEEVEEIELSVLQGAIPEGHLPEADTGVIDSEDRTSLSYHEGNIPFFEAGLYSHGSLWEQTLRSFALELNLEKGPTEVPLTITKKFLRIRQTLDRDEFGGVQVAATEVVDTVDLDFEFTEPGVRRSKVVRFSCPQELVRPGGAEESEDRIGWTGVKDFLLEVDLSYDADNDNGFDFSIPNDGEIQAARELILDPTVTRVERPGKILHAMSGDTDSDGVPDFADGFSDLKDGFSGDLIGGIGRTGLTPAQAAAVRGAEAFVEDNTPQTGGMVPILVHAPDSDTEGLELRISYESSDPKSVWVETVEQRKYFRLPSEGTLRLWTKDRRTEDCSVESFLDPVDPGDFIPGDESGVVIAGDFLDNLDYNEARGAYVFWVESVDASKITREGRINFEVSLNDPDSELPPTILIEKNAYFTAIDLRLAQLVPVEDEMGVEKEPIMRNAAGEVEVSHPSPLIDVEVEATRPRFGVVRDANLKDSNGLGWVVDVKISGEITSDFLDTLTRDQGGVINEAFLYVNGADQPARSIPLDVSKTKRSFDLLHPYPYTGRFKSDHEESITLIGVAVTDGTNLLEIRTSDAIFQLDGYSQHSFVAKFPELTESDTGAPSDPGYPNEPDPDQSDSSLTTTTISLTSNTQVSTPLEMVTEFDLAVSGEHELLTYTRMGGFQDGTALFVSPGGDRFVSLASHRAGGKYYAIVTLVEGFQSKIGSVILKELTPSEFAPLPRKFEGAIRSYASYAEPATVTECLLVDKSDGGEFHPYAWEIAGPPELLDTMEEITMGDKTQIDTIGHLGGASSEHAVNADITGIVKEMEEEARIKHEARQRRMLANASDKNAVGIVSFRQGDGENMPSVTDELFAAVSRVRALNLMPESALQFGAGFVVGVAKGGIDMVGGLGGLIKAGAQIIFEGAKKVVRGATLSIKMIFKTAAGLSIEVEQRQAAAMGAESRKTQEKIVKTVKFFGELRDEGAEVIMAILSGRFDKLNHMSGHLRTMMMSAIEIFEGLFRKFANSDDYERGVMIGRATFEISTFFLPWGAAFKAIQVAGKVSKARFLKTLGSRSDYFRSGKGADVYQNVKVKMARPLSTTKMCFVAGTMVHVAHAGMVPSDLDEAALRAIEQIEVGDLVWSRDDQSGEVALKPVANLFTTHPTKLHHLEIDHDGDGEADETLSGTAEHPFWSPVKRSWVPMGDLKPGSQVHLRTAATPAYVLANQQQNAPPGERFTTYNFEVENFHTYFVGDAGVWVHNTAKAPCERISSVFIQIAKKRGGNLRKDRFKILEETKAGFRGTTDIPTKSWAESLKDVQSKMAQDLVTNPPKISVTDLPNVKEMRAFNRRQPSPGTAGNHVHHSVERWIQKDKLGLSEGFDDVPGWMIEGADHTFGAGRRKAGTLAGDLEDAIKPIASGNQLEVTTALKQVYQSFSARILSPLFLW